MPLEARSFDEDLTRAKTVHRPCRGKFTTILTTTLVNISCTVSFAWQILATSWERIVKSYYYSQQIIKIEWEKDQSYHFRRYPIEVFLQLIMHFF